MLRLQPSEIGLTSSEIHAFIRRLEARRRARVDALQNEQLEAHEVHPTIQRGPERSRDSALIQPPRPVALSYSVFSSVEDESNGCGHLGMDKSMKDLESPCYLPAENDSERSSSGVPNLQSPKGSSYSETNRLRGADANSVERSEAADFEDSNGLRHSTSTMMNSSPTFSQTEDPSLQTDPSRSSPSVRFGSTNTQIDGASPTIILSADPQRRRYRPRSWSDPHDSAVPPLILQRRRKNSRTAARLLRRSSCGEVDGLNNIQFKPLCEVADGTSQTVKSQHLISQTPAAYLALCNSASPLEKLASASETMARAIGGWQQVLAFRPASKSFSPTEYLSNEYAQLPRDGYAYRPLKPCQILGASDSGTTPELTVTPASYPILCDGGNDFHDSQSSTDFLVPSHERQGQMESAYLTIHSHSPETISSHDSAPFEAELTPSVSRTALRRRNAVHHSSSTYDSIGTESQSPNTTPIRRRRPRRLHQTPTRRSRPSSNHPDIDRLQVTQHALQAQRARFFRALAQANGGPVPDDAESRWMRFLIQLASSHSDSSDSADGNRADSGCMQTRTEHQHRHSDSLSGSTSVEIYPDPFSSQDELEHPRVNQRRAAPIELSVARGGRPLSELPFVQRPVVPRRHAARQSRSSSDQENREDDAWERFEQERRDRLGRLGGRSHGELNGYGAVDEDDSDWGTPPRAGRLERFLE